MQPYAHLSQVYSLDPSRFPNLNLAGTGEVGVAGEKLQHHLFINIAYGLSLLPSDLCSPFSVTSVAPFSIPL